MPRKWSAYNKIESLDTYDSFNIHAEHFRGTARICERQKMKIRIFKKMLFSSSNHDFKHLIHFYFVLTFLACRLASGAAAMGWLLFVERRTLSRVIFALENSKFRIYGINFMVVTGLKMYKKWIENIC